MFGIRLINDFAEPKRQARRIISEHLAGRGEFSISYFAQLLSATVVCTLGLITNSVAVIIGGMIIAPLMWPILTISYRLTTKKGKISFNPLVILIVSTAVIFLGAALVAFLSPYNEITTEILARTSPTSLEVFIALAAAVIAALAVAIPKISDSVAGVAVATSLVPPLCVAGIGLAYLDLDVLYGGLLLFLTNVFTIMFVSTFVFSLLIHGKDFTDLKKKQVTVLAICLILLSFPLYWQLQRSVESASVNNTVKVTIESQLQSYAPNSQLESYQVALSDDDSTVTVRAVILLPPSRTITYEQEQAIVRELSALLGRQVDLSLVQQASLRPITEKESIQLAEQKLIETELITQLRDVDGSIRINSISAELTDDNEWSIVASLRSTTETRIQKRDVQAIENRLEKQIDKPVSLSVEVIKSTLIGG